LFNSDNNTEETGFADAYKSQILNPDDEDDTTSKNLIIILLLVAIIIGLSIFGYMYMSKQTQSQENIDKKEVKAIEEVKEEEIEPPKSQMLNNIDELEENSEPVDTKGIDLPKEVENIKIDEKPEVKEIKQKVKQEIKQKGEETYLEQLADLSKEIDGEEKKK